MSHYIDAVIAAEKECTEWVCCNPAEKLRPIGTVFSEIHEPSQNSTSISLTKYTYKVARYWWVFSHRRGNIGFRYKREEIECIDIELLEKQKNE